MRVHDPTRPGWWVNDEEIYINPNAYGSLRSLLDDLYIHYLSQLVPPYTYGERWLLKLQGPLVLAPIEWLDGCLQSVDEVVPGWLDRTRPVTYGFSPGTVAYLHHQAMMQDLRFTHRVALLNPFGG